MVATTPKKTPKSPAKRGAGKPSPVIGKGKASSTLSSPTPSPRPRGRGAIKPEESAGAVTVDGAISPRGTPRRRSAAVASARMTAMGEQMEIDEKEEIKSKRSLFKAKKSEDDAYDAGLDSAEEDEESDYDEKPKAKRPPRPRSGPSTPRKANSGKTADVDTQDTQSKCQLAENLPAIRDVQGMFTDMVRKLPELKDFIKALGRPLRVATMCSGTESPLLALDKIAAATESVYGSKLGVDHVFSCEIEPFKQAYIERNFAPPILFRDIRELDEDQATTAYGALVDVPGYCDMLVAGTSCVDYSNLNNEKKTLDQQGESGQTFRGMMVWVEKKQPPVVILENVCGAPWEEISLAFQEKGYAAHYMRVDTKRYYIPHTRTRVYLFATRIEPDVSKGEEGPRPGVPDLDPNSKKIWKTMPYPGNAKYVTRVRELSGNKNTPGTLITQWKEKVKDLERPASATLEAFLFDSDDPRVHKGRQMLALPGEDSTRAGTDWARCESRHQRARLEEGLGARRPFTNWEGGCTMPDYAWNDWGKAQTDRVLDLMDIDYLRLAQADTDSTHKTLVWNLSQNVDRSTGSGAAGICPCLTPSMVPFVTNRGGPLVGVEALSLQGIPVDDLLLTRESEGQMSDLAGNAMTTTVVGVCMLSALLLRKDAIVAHSKVVAKGLKEEAAKRAKRVKEGGDKASAATTLSVGGAAYASAAAAKVAGIDGLSDQDLQLCSVMPKDDKKSYQKLISDATAAARLCVCEAQTGIADAIQRCKDCGHTACSKCGGRPEHNYELDKRQRKEPNDFAVTLKRALPMRVKLEGIDVAAALKQGKALAAKHNLFGSDSLVDDSREETWRQWERALIAVKEAEFLFCDVRRADVWIARYACPGEDEVVLELRLGSSAAQAEWRVIVNPAPMTDETPHEVYSHPVARMRVNPGAKHLLEGDWHILIPVRHTFDINIKGQGAKVDSWQETLGMTPPTSVIEMPPKDLVHWTVKRFSEYKVTYGPGADKSVLDTNIEGTYKLFEKCGAAQASLHKRVGNDSLNKSAEMYFFLDPIRNSKGDKDFFVFADNHRRLQYGEHRLHTARVEPRFRPKDHNDGGVTYECYTDGQWMKVDCSLNERKLAAKLAVPWDAGTLGAKSGGCAAAVAIMRARVPLPEVDAKDWPEGDFVTLRNDRSHATFSRLAWFTSRLDLPEGVQQFVPLDNGDAKASKALCNSACPRCAPQPPKLEWVRKVGEKKIEAREDPQQAATFEQALKRRPAPFVVQWRKEKGSVTSPTKKGKAATADGAVGDLVIAVNPATLVHRALANITGGVARERGAARMYDEKKDQPQMEWQVVRHVEMDSAAPLKPFELNSNRRDPYATQPPGWNVEKFPLRPEQLRSLHWMLEREKETQKPWLEEEVAEATLPALGLRMDGRARVQRLVRGGIIADQVGYGKTAITIGCIMSNQIQWPKPAATGAKAKPVSSIPTKATLVLAPSQLLRQWPREVEKFSKRGKLNVVVIRTVADITHLTVAEVQEADVVICATSVLRSPLYFERLARLAGVASLPNCKATGAGRHFASSYRDCLNSLERQVETLTGEGASAASGKVRKGSGKMDDVKLVGPKRLKGANLIKATEAAGGKEGFRHIEAALEGEKPAKKATPKSPAKSPGAFKRQKPRAAPSPAPKLTPVKTKATPKSPTKTPRSERKGDVEMASPVTSPGRRTPKRRASLAVKYTEDAEDDDDSEYEGTTEEELDELDDFDSDEEDKRRKKAARARAAKSKRRTKATPGGDDEAEEPADKDHWGLETKEVQADWSEMTSPPLEMFHFRRVVVDEFTYLQSSDRCVVLGLKSESRWCLSGTPPVGAFADIKDTAALLGTNLGSDEQPRFTKAEITKAETFQFFKEKPTQHWHENRHAVAQGFLDRFVRQNIAEIDEIRSEEVPVDIALRPAERAIYLELDHYLQAMDMKARKKTRGGEKGDRDKRLALVLQGSSTAEEALIKRCAKFELDDDAGHALRTCQDIIDVRQKQLDECKEAVKEKILDLRYFFREWLQTGEALNVELFNDEDKREDNHFVKWETITRSEGVGDPEGTALMHELLDEASWKAAETHKPKRIAPTAGSIIAVHIDGQWRQGKVTHVDGSQKQNVNVEWMGGFAPDKTPKVTGFAAKETTKFDIKKIPLESYKLVKLNSTLENVRKAAEALVGKKGGKRTPAGTPVGTPKKGAKPDAGSAAPTPSKATGTPGQRGAKKLDGELNDKRWHIREEVREVRMLTRELTGRIRSLRFFKSVRDMQRLASGDPVSCQACDAKAGAPASGKKRPAGAVWSKSESGVLSTCGHFGCLKCLRANAAAQECGVPGCSCPARFSSVIEANTLGTESVAAGPKSPTKRAKGKAAAGVGTDEALEMGVHGTKMAHLVQLLKDLPKDERVLVFVQFPDLMRQVSEVLEEAGIKTLKLRGSVHQQTGALDLFQKEELGPKDARVLMLMSRDESASGANLTSANHAIFVHPLLTQSQYEYEASETQAIGRIRRYGQTKLVKVWRLLVRDSIDTEIYKQRTEAKA